MILCGSISKLVSDRSSRQSVSVHSIKIQLYSVLDYGIVKTSLKGFDAIVAAFYSRIGPAPTMVVDNFSFPIAHRFQGASHFHMIWSPCPHQREKASSILKRSTEAMNN